MMSPVEPIFTAIDDVVEADATMKLVVRDLSKEYIAQDKRLLVLDRVNLAIRPRELVCLVGTSGCGKSTLLNILAGLTAPTCGDVLVNDIPVTGRPGSDRGMVFQSYTLYPWLTVAQNVAFGLSLRKIAPAEQRERAMHFLDVVGLSNFADAYPKQLSGGMKQRVAIARAIANEPSILLMDEPFGALDAQTKEQLQQFLLQLWERTHLTILMITHDVEEAIYLSQRMYVMQAHPGRIAQELTIPLPPTGRSLDLKLAPEFITIKRQVLQALRE
jgi:NitT/TauT family transport system ATP-binding protein